MLVGKEQERVPTGFFSFMRDVARAKVRYTDFLDKYTFSEIDAAYLAPLIETHMAGRQFPKSLF